MVTVMSNSTIMFIFVVLEIPHVLAHISKKRELHSTFLDILSLAKKLLTKRWDICCLRAIFRNISSQMT
ncbi:unnamed protein product, partial [Gongylonema pulchrum]|uniref:Secreted protein n=1 Tax=Gongylonema pulchrum TaxID=637853 RepID=A0A183F1B2_9BILA